MSDAARPSRYPGTFAVVVLSVSSYALLQSLILPVLTTFQHALHTSEDTVTWLLTSYLLSASVATPILGRLGDIVGKKKVLVATLITMFLGCVIAALATSIGVMIAARTIQGVGGALFPLSFAIIREQAPPDKVTSGISTVAALLAVGSGAGVILAGPIASALDYHWLFWIPGIVMGLAAVAAFLIVPESTTRAAGHVTVLPAILLSGWLVALIVAVSEGQAWGWTSAKTFALLAIAVVLCVAWLGVEMRTDQPLIDMHMMRLPAVWTTNLVALLFGVGLYSVFTFLPEFVQTPSRAGYGFGSSVTASGFFLLPETVTMFICGLATSHLAARIGSKLVLSVGSFVSVTPFVLLVFAHRHQWEIYLASALIGIGLGFAFAAMSNLIVESVPVDQVGVASGMNANIRTIGGSVGAAIMASIVTSGTRAGGFPKSSGYRDGFAFLAIAAILATLASAFVPKAGREEEAVLAEAHVVTHGETAMVAGAALVDET